LWTLTEYPPANQAEMILRREISRLIALILPAGLGFFGIVFLYKKFKFEEYEWIIKPIIQKVKRSLKLKKS
jgi:hypothetical protein